MVITEVKNNLMKGIKNMNAQEYLNMKQHQKHIRNETRWQVISCIMAMVALAAVVLL